MNFEGFEFDAQTKAFLDELDKSKRLPHALIIESPDSNNAENLAVFLSMYAVCGGEEKPCGVCKNCVNAKSGSHPDITYLKLIQKKTVYTVEQMRELIKDAYIMPNEAAAKVYILKDCDELFSVQAQNTFLKLAEEPPQDVLFILICKNSQSLLETIRSRFTLIRLRGEEQFGGEAAAAAEKIALGIIDNREYPLLRSLNPLKDKEAAVQILSALRLCLRDALALLSGGNPLGNAQTARVLASRLTRKKIIEMIELCGSSSDKLKQNVNINLLTTWMCGELRRITWQR